ncbi:MAG: hypothetical protein DRR16_13260 [Candidatus Parabeggiatoa sp. nov. 3]|nr:MAG: hypothetical protein DRR00_31270 [Gammaproteobacteria bacterium]RKZ56029.1 MAG: hypothetical protein DRQ99_29220 [Gammaproteobacteria bacterium]RKZ84974.1 MAG: hypothetical protein DRR16_13260 [Gammaproteobacteria bacterium]
MGIKHFFLNGVLNLVLALDLYGPALYFFAGPLNYFAAQFSFQIYFAGRFTFQIYFAFSSKS